MNNNLIGMSEYVVVPRINHIDKVLALCDAVFGEDTTTPLPTPTQMEGDEYVPGANHPEYCGYGDPDCPMCRRESQAHGAHGCECHCVFCMV